MKKRFTAQRTASGLVGQAGDFPVLKRLAIFIDVPPGQTNAAVGLSARQSLPMLIAPTVCGKKMWDRFRRGGELELPNERTRCC